LWEHVDDEAQGVVRPATSNVSEWGEAYPLIIDASWQILVTSFWTDEVELDMLDGAAEATKWTVTTGYVVLVGSAGGENGEVCR
jgi:hypothetical protein